MRTGLIVVAWMLAAGAGRMVCESATMSGFVLNKNETPFEPLYWDRYEQIKPRGDAASPKHILKRHAYEDRSPARCSVLEFGI